MFSRSGKSKKYPDFVKSTGYGTGAGLGGWNCRHSFYPFFEGISHRAYTDTDLKDYNAKKYAYNGKSLTEYEASQIQRRIERNIRRWKREEIGMGAAKLPTDEARAKVAHWQSVQRDFIRQTGLKRQRDREQIYGNGVVSLEKRGIIKSDTKYKSNSYSTFSTEKKLQKHLEKHLNEYGDITTLEYLEKAQSLLNSNITGNIDGFTDKDGFVFRYDIKENDFAVGRPDGKISTLYKPKEGIKYWEGEKENYEQR